MDIQTIIIAIIALGVGSLITYLIMKNKIASSTMAILKENANVQSQRDTAQKEVELLKEQMRQNKVEQAKVLQQQLEMAKEQMQNATHEILKQREETLSKLEMSLHHLKNNSKPFRNRLLKVLKPLPTTKLLSSELSKI